MEDFLNDNVADSLSSRKKATNSKFHVFDYTIAEFARGYIAAILSVGRARRLSICQYKYKQAYDRTTLLMS